MSNDVNKVAVAGWGTFFILFAFMAMFLESCDGPTYTDSQSDYLKPSEKVLRYREEKRQEELRTNLEALQVIDDWNNNRLK